MEHARKACRAAIAVVGLGPRGMILVERLMAHLRQRPELAVELLLFDGSTPGPGLHGLDLPDYLLLNTVAGQLSFYPHPDAVGGGARHEGPTFDQWCRARDVRLDEEGVTVDSRGDEVTPGRFLPRRLLGAYLADCARKLVSRAPANARVRLVAEKVSDIGRSDDGRRHWLGTASGRRYRADRVFLAVGHGPSGWVQARISPDAVAPREVVILDGLGLTAMDMVAALTKGRRGIFRRDGDTLRYHPSGREPKILLSSRTGLPFRARPDWGPQDEAHRIRPIFFTAATVDRLRDGCADGRLDFREDVLPLIALEMQAVYRITETRLCQGAGAAAALEATLREERSGRDPATALRRLDGSATGIFDPWHHLRTEPWRGDPETYQRGTIREIERDVGECRRGVLGSPLKAALEVWRTQRDTLRYTVNGESLTDASRAQFYAVYAPLSNRLVGGPQKERHEELTALVEADIVTLRPPRHVSDLPGEWSPRESRQAADAGRTVRAHIGSSGLTRRDAPLLASLRSQGRIRSVEEGVIDGILVDAHGHPVGATGEVDQTLWIVGSAVEGSSYYNHYVGTPAPDCPLFRDAEQQVRRCLGQLPQAADCPVASDDAEQ